MLNITKINVKVSVMRHYICHNTSICPWCVGDKERSKIMGKSSQICNTTCNQNFSFTFMTEGVLRFLITAMPLESIDNVEYTYNQFMACYANCSFIFRICLTVVCLPQVLYILYNKCQYSSKSKYLMTKILIPRGGTTRQCVYDSPWVLC